MPCSLASVISFSKKDNKAFLLSTVASIISASNRCTLCFSVVFKPLFAIWCIPMLVAFASVIDFSLFAKSPSVIVATCVFESADQAPIECGFLRA